MKTSNTSLLQVAIITAALFFMAGFQAEATSILWTNTSGGNWSAATNWNPHQVPTNADVVLITTPGTYLVTLDVINANQYSAVTLGAGGGAAGVQTFAISNTFIYSTNMLVNKGGVLTANHGTFGFSGGQTMTVSGGVFNATSGSILSTLIVTNGGLVNSSNNIFSAVTVANGIFNSLSDSDGSTTSAAVPSGLLTVGNGGVLNVFSLTLGYSGMAVASNGVVNLLDSPVPLTISYSTLSGPLTNAGTINMTNAGFLIQNNVYFGVGGLVNLAGGSINFRANGGITASVGSPPSYFFGYIVNHGAITQTGGTNSISAPVFDLALGTITNLAGALSLGTYQTNLAGTYYAASGAVIQFNAVNDGTSFVTPGTPLVLAGNGQYQFVSGDLEYLTNAYPNLDLQGTLLALGPGFQGGAITNLVLDGISFVSNSLPVTGTFAVTNSTLYGNLSVANGGVFTATNGYLVGTVAVGNGAVFTVNQFVLASSVTVAAGGVLNLAGAINLRNPLTNSGTLNISNAAISIQYYVPAGDFGGIINQAGGLITFTGTGSSIFYNDGPEYFINRGRLQQNSPAATNTINILGLDTSQGTVTNLAGTLVLETFQTNLAGTFNTAASATIQIVGGTAAAPLTPGATLQVTGTGQSQFISGYLFLPTNSIPNLALQGGTLELGPAFEGGVITNLTVSGMTVTNSFPVKGTFTATNQSTLYGNFTVTNGGVFNYGATENGAVTVASGGLMTLVQGGLFNSGSSLTLAAGGTLNITGGIITLLGPLTSAGNINVTNPPTSFISGFFSYNDGSATYRGGIINQASGQINLSGDNTYLTTQGGGSEYLVNQGQVTKSAGTNFSIFLAPFTTNSGAITVKSGKMGLRPFVTLPGGSLNVMLNSATNYGSFLITSNVVLAGAFNATLTNGYVPTNGTVFSVMNYSNYSGSFSSLGLPGTVSWQSSYGTTNFSLVVGSPKPQFAGFNLSGTNLIFKAIGGTAGSNYVVLVSTNLTIPLTNWLALTTNTFDGTGQFHYTNNVNPAKPRQFFIFKLP